MNLKKVSAAMWVLIFCVGSIAISAPIQTWVDGNNNAIGVSGNPLQVNGSVSSMEQAGSWTTIRTNVVANDTATTIGTSDVGNFSTSGYQKVRFRIMANATTDSFSFACGTATPTTNPNYAYTVGTTFTGRNATAPYACSCDTDGNTLMFPKVYDLSSGANVTTIKYQLYN
jgi:hypothetical protein